MARGRGRPRGANDSIPKHIDQSRIPKGAYWDSRHRVWYTLIASPEGKQRRKNIAKADAKLSELHRILEDMGAGKRDTLGWLCDLFHASAKFKALAEKTRQDYEAQRKTLETYKTKSGVALEDRQLAGITPPYLQRLIDKIGEQHPSKANHLARYLSRVFNWGIIRGRCQSNPAKGLEKMKERKLRRLPSPAVYSTILDYARAKHADYLWIFMELAYLLRLRGIEVLTLTDANELKEGVLTNRRKGSRDNIVQWTPRLRAAWDAGLARRKRLWADKGVTPIKPSDRLLLVNSKGAAITRQALNTLWQTMITNAISEGVILEEDRFGPHDLKRKGITETKGTRHDKREGSGHRDESMMDVYDLEVPLVPTPGETLKHT